MMELYWGVGLKSSDAEPGAEQNHIYHIGNTDRFSTKIRAEIVVGFLAMPIVNKKHERQIKQVMPIARILMFAQNLFFLGLFPKNKIGRTAQKLTTAKRSANRPA